MFKQPVTFLKSYIAVTLINHTERSILPTVILELSASLSHQSCRYRDLKWPRQIAWVYRLSSHPSFNNTHDLTSRDNEPRWHLQFEAAIVSTATSEKNWRRRCSFVADPIPMHQVLTCANDTKAKLMYNLHQCITSYEVI